MSKIKEAFQNGKAFIPFITCGDPDLNTTKVIIKNMVESGADLIELGIPFSDPVAEGPVIQNANCRALAGGIKTENIFEMVEELRKEISVPMVFMTYANVVFSYGIEKFAEKSYKIGMDGIILPDVPFEEKEEFVSSFRKYGLDFISFVTPSSYDRIQMIAREATGFVYCVSSLGVTGMRTNISTKIDEMIQSVKEVNPDIPCAIGFGISNEEQAKIMSEYADGIIVGSAIMDIIAKHGKSSAPYVTDFVKDMKSAILNRKF